MKMMRSVGISLVMVLLSAPLVRGQDLSKYRDFSLGMSLPELSNQVDLRPLQAKLIRKHQAIIQELTCWPSGSSGHSRPTGSVWQIFFSFYNGQLFRILVTYDQDATHRLTAEDMVQAISTKYGSATSTAGEISFPTNELYRTTEKVIARWEDSQYSINLVRSRFLNSFALVMFSKRLDGEAEAAIAKSLKMGTAERNRPPEKKAKDPGRFEGKLKIRRKASGMQGGQSERSTTTNPTAGPDTAASAGTRLRPNPTPYIGLPPICEGFPVWCNLHFPPMNSTCLGGGVDLAEQGGRAVRFTYSPGQAHGE